MTPANVVQKTCGRLEMHLYTDDHPETTLSGLSYTSARAAKRSLQRIDAYFDALSKAHVLGTATPACVRPQRTLHTTDEVQHYYTQQKRYRVIGMCNRARGQLARAQKPHEMRAAIAVYDKWLLTHRCSPTAGAPVTPRRPAPARPASVRPLLL